MRGRALSLAWLAIIASAPAMVFPDPAAAQTSTSESVDPVARHVAEASRRFGIPQAWIWAVMRAESAGDVRAVSRAGAMGLMQIMPDTWTYLRARHGLGDDPYYVRDNIIAGTAYLRELHDRFGSPGFLAAYNAGPGRYEQHLATGRPLPRETRAYLAMLAPMVGGSQPGRANIAPSDPLEWTRAPLFAMRAADTHGAPRATTETPPDDETAAQAVAPEEHPDRLFIPLSGREPS
ncbi:transglycosylase-like protein with SLT domain [Hephaestia caeni]|uniref:Transglycosylase-like protein with SLT domain n=2 Tax=Hephaestia caeni TaxID=645617 RepID=A0A397NUL6_9SPHN|nr:transglycosylase-like protein with SLT domain [Hephaestia caeni]